MLNPSVPLAPWSKGLQSDPGGAMRNILIAVALGATAASVEARTKKTVIVQHETDHGWSEGLCRTIDFFAASEISERGPYRAEVEYPANYAAVEFSAKRVVLVKLHGFTWSGEATSSNVKIFTPWTGQDQKGVKWLFSTNYTCR
jgi:hypothetical protein